ncbi:MAG: NAD(P)H-dependent oxidoreductase subunit E [Pseudomonadota bacterium]|nr:NAD(P)H-dependent oxidoreductase subunit E [Pseudomonadota bacterium]|tara:strand:+ start:631 stop:1131 length:501 start_codon:yes stop_codon:yes gene_type:complete
MNKDNENFVINEEISEHIEKIKKKFPSDKNKSSIIESLLLLQHKNNGYVTKAIMKSLARYLDINEIDVYEVATFYSMINTEPVGENIISVCTNVSCMLKNSKKILEHIEKKLQTKTGNTTKDNKFFIKNEIECLAACDGAPMMQINHKNYENLTIEKVDKILEELK